jgi:predicted nuclease with TOPRIM domain
MEGRLQTMQVDKKNYLQEAERSRSEIDAIKKSLEDSEKMNQTLEEKFSKAKKTLDHYLQYSVEMKKLDLSET